MSKKYEIRKIKSKRSYTFKEISTLLGVHVRTVQSWHKAGLMPLDGSNNPYLIMGSEVHRYMKQQILKNKVTLNNNEFYCMGCRTGVVPQVTYKYINATKIGGGKPSVTLKGECPFCSRKVNKFSSEQQSILEDKSNIEWALEHPRKD